MTTLLSVESLIFAVASLSLALMHNANLPVSARSGARALMRGMASLVSVMAAGAIVAWGSRFFGNWPSSLSGLIPVVCIAVGILAQPVLAWAVAWMTLRKAKAAEI